MTFTHARQLCPPAIERDTPNKNAFSGSIVPKNEEYAKNSGTGQNPCHRTAHDTDPGTKGHAVAASGIREGQKKPLELNPFSQGQTGALV